jgi:hypothetical protein
MAAGGWVSRAGVILSVDVVVVSEDELVCLLGIDEEGVGVCSCDQDCWQEDG